MARPQPTLGHRKDSGDMIERCLRPLRSQAGPREGQRWAAGYSWGWLTCSAFSMRLACLE